MEKKKSWKNWLLFFVVIVAVIFIALLTSSILERRAEAVFAYSPQISIGEWEVRSALWGENFPMEYDTWLQTEESDFFTKYNGNGMIDMLAVDPRMVVLWAGYSFSKGYNQARGHKNAIIDQKNILRTGGPTGKDDGPMPATCWTCKGPDIPRVMNDLKKKLGPKEGIAEFYRGKWARWGEEMVNTIGCADCHNPETMELTITRPALIEAFERQGKDITKATHQEMRSLVCAQCHVEYYFDKTLYKDSPYLVLPWDEGLTVEGAEKYYDKRNFKDWTHKLSRAPMLKAQHPGYETYLTGVHADRGVSCADCHMPYKNEGGVKYSNHHIESPLHNVANTCQVCHREETAKLVANVYERQDKIIQNRDKLEELLVRAHVEAKFAWDIGATEEQMKDILMDIRHAQWRWDYAAASHGASFHSPVEIGRIISTGITIAQEGRIKLARVLSDLGHNKPIPYPDISTKAKAQKYIGLDMDKLNAEKELFLKEVNPKWLQKAKEREDKMPIKRI